jgi:hypothetical protein
VDVSDHWVYKVYDAQLLLIYVGVTGVGPGRLSAHARSAEWAPLAATILVEHFPARAGALEREAELIRRQCPRFNLSANPEAYPLEPGEMSVRTAAAVARCSTRSVRRAIRAGWLPARPGPRGHIIEEQDLQAWIEGSPAQ